MMKTRLLRIVPILLLATIALAPGWGWSGGPTPRAARPAAPPVPKAPASGATTRVSIASDGSPGNNASWDASISADGRYVAFTSWASNLVSEDTSGSQDVFVHDRQTGITERISVGFMGYPANAESLGASISANARYVVFESWASNLVGGDTNNVIDVFVYDRQTGITERISVAGDGNQGNDFSYTASISADGRYVAFSSHASNLVEGDTNGWEDVFVRDRQSLETERVSVTSDGRQGNRDSNYSSISADGRYVAFESWASNLVSGDTNHVVDIFVHDRQTGVTKRVSLASDGSQGNDGSAAPSISANGRFVAFKSYAINLVNGDTNGWWDIFVHDRKTGITERVSVASDSSQGNDESTWAAISADGRYVVFDSIASNLVSGDTNDFCYNNGYPPNCRDVFVHDRQTGITQRVSVASDDRQGNSTSDDPSISADGRYIAFSSVASNLVGEDTNGWRDVFVRDRGEGIGGYVIYLPVTQNQP